MKKILTVSLFAMMAVSAANADIASTKYVDDINTSIQTQLDGKQASLGYTAENSANKVTTLTSTSSDTQYPSAKVVYTELNKKENTSNKIDTMPEKLQNITDGQYPSAKAVFQYVSGQMTTVNSNNNALFGKVESLENAVIAKGALQDVVGNADSGLVKDVADLKTNKADKTYVNTELGKKQNNLSATQMDAVNSTITSDKVTKYEAYDAKITAAKKAGDDAQATANSAVTVNTQQATAISGNTAAINTLKGDKTVTGSVAKSIDDAFTAANLSQYATTSTMNTELGKKQNNLSADQLSAVNSGITSDKVTKYEAYDAKITAAKKAGDDAQKTADGAVSVNNSQATAISANTTAISAINNEQTGILAKAKADATSKANAAQSAAESKVTELQNGAVKTNTDNITTITTNLGGLNGVTIPEACKSGRCALVMEAGEAKWETING